MRPDPRDTSIISTAVQAQSRVNPRVDFAVHAPLERVAPATPCRSGLEDHSPPVFCARLVVVVPAESVNIKFCLRGRGHNFTVCRGRDSRMRSIRVDPAVRHLQRGPAANRVQPPEIIFWRRRRLLRRLRVWEDTIGTCRLPD